MADDDGPLGLRLAELLRPHLDVLVVPEPEPEPEPEPPHRLDEAELMALIFTHLDDENPRVCEGIDFARLEVLVEHTPAPGSERETERETEPPPFSQAAQAIDEFAQPHGQPRPSPERLEFGWVGASWTDDIATVPSEWLDRPQPSPAQLALLRAIAGRPLAQLHLRRLERELALRHLELFVHACRAKRLGYCRVIPGKGVNSRAEPVLKRAVLEWCRGPGRARVLAWAPELDHRGEWGSLVLRLSAPRINGNSGTTRR